MHSKDYFSGVASIVSALPGNPPLIYGINIFLIFRHSVPIIARAHASLSVLLDCYSVADPGGGGGVGGVATPPFRPVMNNINIH